MLDRESIMSISTGSITDIFGALSPNLMPDKIKIKMRFLPSYTWIPKKGKPNFLYKLFHPKIYIVKMGKAWRLDPLVGEYFKPVDIKEVETEPKFTILDFIIFSFISYGVYKTIKAFLPEIRKLKGR